MDWRLYTDATATAAAYEAALARIFGTGAGEARDDRARNGSRPDHPLHALYAAKTAAEGAWVADSDTPRIIPSRDLRETQQNCGPLRPSF
jgi:hypothetical protein